MKTNLRLKNFPISFFAPVLGFAGFSLAVLKLEPLTRLSRGLSLALIYFSIGLFVVVSLVYLLKIFVFRKEALKEFFHPVKINFFPLVAKIFLVFSIIALTLHWRSSYMIWLIGVVLQSIFSLIILRIWVLHTHFRIKHLSPAWFIPVVGNIMIPIAGMSHVSVEINWFFFTVGIFWMFVLMNIILYRVIFHEPMPEKLLPTFFITFAAPSIGFIAYTKITGELNAFGHILYYLSLFLFVLNLTLINAFAKIKFYLSWWAYSFPLAAFILASLLFTRETGIGLFGVIAVIVLALLSILILLFSVRTLWAIGRKEICIEE